MLSMRNDPRPARLEIITNCGPADGTFDPSIKTSYSTTITCNYGDGSQETLTGTTHNFSHTYAAVGPHRAVFRGVPLGAITVIDFKADCVTQIKNLRRCINATIIQVYGNADLSNSLIDYCSATSDLRISDTSVFGGCSAFPNSERIYATGCPKITGKISEINAPSCQYLRLNMSTNISAGSIAQFVAIREIYIYSMGWNQASVDLVITSMWGARAAYTYNGASMQIGGTNAAPSGNFIAPIEGADWHEDTPGHWIPLTPKAMIYDLLNDVNSEGFKKWAVISAS